MGEQDLHRIRNLFTSALELPSAEREAWLQSECGDDARLLKKLVRMIKAHDEDHRFLENGPISLDARGIEDMPRTIGNYQIIQQIGEGGMGVVYLAEQTQPIRRRVALKLIKLGMDTKAVVARFEAERQALALLEHPSVARVFEAGATETGRPYFVMEYVPGEPITKFCDAHNLTLRERLDLFVQVCHAIQHAHQKGIIHRDIKPSNVLVMRKDGDAVPKVIDFGVAKATDHRLTEQTLFTEHGVLIGTPSYMSPEQAELSAIGVDARTDVYSLGVLLYEMIVGVLPFETADLGRAGYAEIQRIIREVEPTKPSTRFWSLGDVTRGICETRRCDRKTMHRQLSGDLDWIALKAIDKDPARRYASASELAADILRHVRDEPVIASPPSTTYRMRKFVRRHRGGVAASVIVLLTLILGIIGTSIGWRRASRAEANAAAKADEAKRQAEIATAVNDFLVVDLLSAVSPSAERGKGRNVLMRDVLDAAAERIDAGSAPGGRFAAMPAVEASIRQMLGVTYMNLGELKSAEPHLQRAYDLNSKYLGPRAIDTIRSINALGQINQAAGRHSQAQELYRQAVDTAMTELGPDHAMTMVAMNNLATLFHLQGRYEESSKLFRELVTSRRRVLGDGNSDTIATVSNLAISLARSNKLDEAEALLREWLPIAQRSLPEGDPNISFIMKNLGETLAQKGSISEARNYMTQALEIRRRVFGDEHPSTLTSRHDLAILLSMEGRNAEAADLFKQVTEARVRVLGEAHAETLSAKSNLANSYIALGRADEAERLLKECATVAERQYGPDHGITMRVTYLLGWLYLQQGRLADADATNTRLLEAQRRVLGLEHPQTLATLESVAWTQFQQQKYGESEDNHRELLSILERTTGPANPATRRIAFNLAAVLLAKKETDEARSIVARNLEIEKDIATADDATGSQMIACARLLLNAEPEDLRDPSAALDLANRACEIADNPDAESLAVLALAQYRSNDVQAAIETQERAIRALPADASNAIRREFEKQLLQWKAPSRTDAPTHSATDEISRPVANPT
ncbi:MAG: tetratricopeptide repeat protein [Phycisphaerales bacterium]|nr:tetratricopeptide repeat protein [Phycisphaerales bacterium]MCB9854203.1 tetratricopeptide repeat protein [Phycisphaerales bacterium]MCB9864280.1 tetratricopeptide repeat protein [Phycisphaerales bacterium]